MGDLLRIRRKSKRTTVTYTEKQVLKINICPLVLLFLVSPFKELKANKKLSREVGHKSLSTQTRGHNLYEIEFALQWSSEIRAVSLEGFCIPLGMAHGSTAEFLRDPAVGPSLDLKLTSDFAGRLVTGHWVGADSCCLSEENPNVM